MYSLCHVLAFLIALIFNIWYAKKYNITKGKALLFTLIVWPSTYLFMLLLAWAETGFKNFGGQNIVRVFIYIPIISYFTCKILKLDFLKTIDYFAFCPAFSQAIGHIGCLFAGCCAGRIITIGEYTFQFPSQISEIVVVFLIIIYLYLYAKGKQFNTKGKVYPLFLILFGSTRFILEFFRDNQKIFGEVSYLALHAALMVIVGVIWLLILKKRPAKEETKEVNKTKISKMTVLITIIISIAMLALVGIYLCM